MAWRITSISCLVLLVAVASIWVLHGSQVYTKTATQVTVRDELFGTESVEWKPGLWIGLDIAGPAGAVLAAVALVGFVRTTRRRKDNEGGV